MYSDKDETGVARLKSMDGKPSQFMITPRQTGNGRLCSNLSHVRRMTAIIAMSDYNEDYEKPTS
jgi:hypothetical protein